MHRTLQKNCSNKTGRINQPLHKKLLWFTIILSHPKMNAFVERVNGTVQTEYLDRFYEETSIGKINEILYDCLIEYNFYRPHRSLNLLTPIEYCSKLNNRDAEMVQMYWTQTLS